MGIVTSNDAVNRCHPSERGPLARWSAGSLPAGLARLAAEPAADQRASGPRSEMEAPSFTPAPLCCGAGCGRACATLRCVSEMDNAQHDFVGLLRSELARRKTSNRRYSLRAFAR